MENAVAGHGQKGSPELAGLYLTFWLGDETYGLEILAVQEIIQLVETTAVPRTPSYVRGVINLRGKIIPIVDLRMKFGMEAIDDSSQTCIIVVDVKSGDNTLTMGVVVDKVAEVTDIVSDQIEPPPAFGAAVDTNYLLGMGKVGGKVIILLDIHRVLSDKEVNALADMDSTSA